MVPDTSLNRILFVFVALALKVQDGAGISCFTCSSHNHSNPSCEDPINTQLSRYTEKCTVPKKNHIGLFPANFCIKITGTNAETNEKLVIRSCAMKSMDSQCGMFRYQGASMSGCVLTCDYNGCNKSHILISSFYALIASIGISVWIGIC